MRQNVLAFRSLVQFAFQTRSEQLFGVFLGGGEVIPVEIFPHDLIEIGDVFRLCFGFCQIVFQRVSAFGVIFHRLEIFVFVAAEADDAVDFLALRRQENRCRVAGIFECPAKGFAFETVAIDFNANVMCVDVVANCLVRVNQLVQLLTAASPFGVEIGEKRFIIGERFLLSSGEIGFFKPGTDLFRLFAAKDQKGRPKYRNPHLFHHSPHMFQFNREKYRK